MKQLLQCFQGQCGPWELLGLSLLLFMDTVVSDIVIYRKQFFWHIWAYVAYIYIVLVTNKFCSSSISNALLLYSCHFVNESKLQIINKLFQVLWQKFCHCQFFCRSVEYRFAFMSCMLLCKLQKWILPGLLTISLNFKWYVYFPI